MLSFSFTIEDIKIYNHEFVLDRLDVRTFFIVESVTLRNLSLIGLSYEEDTRDKRDWGLLTIIKHSSAAPFH